MYIYSISRLPGPIDTLLNWDSAPWSTTGRLVVDQFRAESSDHRPRTQARFLHDGHCLYGLFQVEDRYVRCVNTEFQSRTHRDSCVELFLQPKDGKGYFNFELNCGGTLAVFYITNPTRTADLFQGYTKLSVQDVSPMRIASTLPARVDPEITTAVTWRLGFSIPVSILETYCGPLMPLAGSTWRANVYKCGDETSHPHWAAWSPVPELNFHLPSAFGKFQFR